VKKRVRNKGEELVKGVYIGRGVVQGSVLVGEGEELVKGVYIGRGVVQGSVLVGEP